MTHVERFDPDFANDVIDATSYYDAISAALGNLFRDALRETLRETLREVRQRPLSFGFTRQPSRGAMLPKFPYVVIFRVTETPLIYGGCFHSSSDPARWRERMAKQDGR